MKNMSSLISAHNKKVLRPSINTYGCNRVKMSCPLNNKCQMSRIVYRADVSNNVDTETKFYYGLTDTTLRRDIITIKNLLDMKDTVTIPNCLNIFGSYMSKEKNIKLSGVLFERLIVVLVLIFASYV